MNMLSTDREILLDISGQIVRINSELQAIRTEQRSIHEEQRLLNAKIDWLQHSIYWGFALIGIIAAALALWLPAPRAKERQSEQAVPSQPTLQPIVINVPASAYAPQPEQKTRMTNNRA